MSKGMIFKMNASIALATMLILVLIGTSAVTIQAITELKAKILDINEQVWRAQSRSTLTYLKNNFLRDANAKRFDPQSDYDVQLWGENRLLGLKNGSPSSDSFIIEIGRGKFLYDASADCATSDSTMKEKFIEDNYDQHTYPELAKAAYIEMRKGYDTKYGDNNYWSFNSNREWLEWILIPNPQIGLKGESPTLGGIKNEKFRNILIQLGTQSNEVEKPWKDVIRELDNLRIMLYIICTTVIILSFLFGIYFIIRIKRLEAC